MGEFIDEEYVVSHRENVSNKLFHNFLVWLNEINYYRGYVVGKMADDGEYGIRGPEWNRFTLSWSFETKLVVWVESKSDDRLYQLPDWVAGEEVGTCILINRSLMDSFYRWGYPGRDEAIYDLVKRCNEELRYFCRGIEIRKNVTFCESKYHAGQSYLADCEPGIGGWVCGECGQRLNEERAKAERDAEEKRFALLNEKAAAKALAAAERAKMTPSRRLRIMQRDNFHCVFCGRGREDGIKLHVDHIIPIAKGGKTEDDNLQTLCNDCNAGKSDHVLEPQSEVVSEKS